MPDHLKPTVTDRGFVHMEPIPVWSGYEFLGEPMDFDNMGPREVGTVRVYESSDAMFPSIWLNVEVSDPLVNQEFDHAVEITVENARKLGEQLVALADEHYSSRSVDPVDTPGVT